MNWIDALLLLVVALAVWGGWQRGFISSMLALLTWVGSFAAGYFLYPFAATVIQRFIPSVGVWTNAVAFISMVVLSRILLSLCSRLLLQQTTEAMHRRIVNKVFGIAPGFVNGLIQGIVIAALLLTLPFQNRVSDKARESPLANRFAPPAFRLARELSPIFSDPLRNTVPGNAAPHDEKEFVKLPFTIAHPNIREDLEARMLVLVNEERAKENLKPLRADPEMQVVARAHSKDMFARGYFAHLNLARKDPFDRMEAAGVRFSTAGENLAFAQTLQQAHDGLMKSPGHRANILQPHFGRVGIGILDGGIYGLMITQDFRN